MSQAPDNVTPIKSPEQEDPVVEAPETKERKPADLSKIALVIALLSVVLSVIFFFGVNRNLSGLSNEVKDIGTIRSNVEALDMYVDGLLEQMGRVNTRIMEMEDQPRKEAVRVLQESMVNDMLRRTEFMESQLAEIAPDDAQRAAKLAQLQALLLDLQGGGQQAVSVQTTPAETEAVEVAPAENTSTEAAPAETVPAEAAPAESGAAVVQPGPDAELTAPEGTGGQDGPNDPTGEGEATIEEATEVINELFNETQLMPTPEGHQLVPAPEAIQPAQ